jgi:hypothetical protein
MKRAAALAIVSLLLTAGARAADAPADSQIDGVWTATKASGEAFRGFWTAEVAVATPRVALGTWTLTNGIGDVMMNGTWSARQAPRGWRGAWSARVAGTNQVLSGTWEADDSTLKGAKTFRDLLTRTAQKQIAGVWHLGRAHGNWWLKAKG